MATSIPASLPAATRRSRAKSDRRSQLIAAAERLVAERGYLAVRLEDIGAAAGVSGPAIYRHFPTRADLIVAVYRHQVEACAEAGPSLLHQNSSALVALAKWIDLFVDFLVTKHGLAGALQSQSATFETLHAYFIDRLVPVCARLLDAAAETGEIVHGVDAYGLMRGIGNLCIGADTDPDYDARRMVQLVIAGLRPQ